MDNGDEVNANAQNKMDNVDEVNVNVQNKMDDVDEVNVNVQNKMDNVDEVNVNVQNKMDNVDEVNVNVQNKMDNVDELKARVKHKTDNVDEVNTNVKNKMNNVDEFKARDQNEMYIVDEVKTKRTEDEQCNKVVDYDDLVSAAGEFGPYQAFLTLCTFPFYVFGVFAYYGQLFLTEASPNHWCWVPELANLTAFDRRKLAIPLDRDARFGYSQCETYIANWTEVSHAGIPPNQSWPTKPCHSWEFNETEIPYPTITTEMGWVCDKASYQANAQAVFFVGSVAGGLIFGWLSDRFGRIPAAVASNIIGCVGGIVSIFAENFLQFTICRFLMGMSYDCCMMMTYLIVLEFVAPKYRSMMANLPFSVFYSLAATALPWIALACGHWKTLSLVMSIPMALALLTPIIVPESPKWLLIRGRIDEATDQIVKIARINKKEVPLKLIEQFKTSARNTEPAPARSLLDLATRPSLRNILICLCIEYMCCMITFDALVRSLGSLQFNFFISFTLVSFTEFPALVLISFILDLTGRKWLTVLCFLVCCACCFLAIFVGAGLPSVACAIIARFTMNMTANIAMQWGAEMLPTPVRGSAASFIRTCGFVASILSPYIVYLENYVTWLPFAVICVITLIGAASTLVLPETAGRVMPQTFDDAETLNRNQKCFDVPCLRKVRSNGQNNPSFEMD